MLPRDERRRLREIEQQLIGDDPKLARRLTESSALRRVWAHMSPRVALAAVSAFIAVLCLLLGEGGGVFTAGAVAVLAVISRNWQIRLD
ncbi:DUF3040 domain-containing protein [Saccharopolyspora sp. K220]|uniref:DUF3040 domain-containing protein n=1 Tax=Saccharopolyspora soli TaxID=2926618 RepID=UPI001F55CED9|nr:DUF3040 domain-containing protein [Saccharopolyspora soli]MCI2424219.1 DUF3040 domain-containing protein [Saccharopolyspora soli]